MEEEALLTLGDERVISERYVEDVQAAATNNEGSRRWR